MAKWVPRRGCGVRWKGAHAGQCGEVAGVPDG